jgi:hypothetical protein
MWRTESSLLNLLAGGSSLFAIRSECLTIFAYDTRAYDKNNCTCIMVCSPDAPAGGMQDLDMESAALEEAIKLYKNLWAASRCKMKAVVMMTSAKLALWP